MLFFILHGERVLLYTDQRALQLMTKRNRANRQDSAQLTRRLHRLAHFNIST